MTHLDNSQLTDDSDWSFTLLPQANDMYFMAIISQLFSTFSAFDISIAFVIVIICTMITDVLLLE